jgi:type II secretory pathway pseudopilin PulG
VTGRAPARDAGESLIELLVTVVILGIATAGIVGALLAVGTASQTHRRLVLAQNALRSWAEQIGTGPYTDCANTGNFAAPSQTLPTGFSAAVTGVQYWDGAAFAGTCGTDTGIQRVTLRITALDGLSPAVNQSGAIVVRKPCASSC